MRIVRPQPAGLRCRVRLADGRVFTGALPPARHRAIQLGLLHADTAGLVELTPGTRRADGKLALDRRRRAEHYLPGGASRRPRLARARCSRTPSGSSPAPTPARAGDGAARGGVRRRRAARRAARGDKHAIAAHAASCGSTSTEPGELPALWALLAERPCHLLIESGGSGGAHAYWKLAGRCRDARRAAHR